VMANPLNVVIDGRAAYSIGHVLGTRAGQILKNYL
jgi:hypothetical protein